MTDLPISESLAQQLQQTAEEKGLSVAVYLEEMMWEERAQRQRRKIHEEQSWWLSRSLNTRARYEGQYVALHNEQVVDSDADVDALHRRVRSRYGSTAVAIIPAEGPREFKIYGGRIVSR